MSQRPSSIFRFLRELKRRKIYRVAVTYGAVGLALTEAASHVFDALLFPPWAHRLFVVMVIFGFPVAMVLAWAFEVTPDGVRRAAGPSELSPEGEEGGREPETAGVGRSGPGAPDGVLARHGRTIAFGIAAGLVTVVAIGLWTAGDQADVPLEDGAERVTQVDSTGAKAPDPEGAPSADGEGGPGAETEDQEAVDVEATGPEGAADAAGTQGVRPAGRSEAESPAGPDGGGATDAVAEPARAASRPGQPRDGTGSEADSYRGVAVLIDGEGHPGYRTAENVILEQLATGGIHVLDRTSMELQSALSEDVAPRPGQLGRRVGARAVVIGSYRASASPSVGGFYTGSATLSVRTYDARSGRLLSSKTYRVGGGGTPGKMGNTPDAAATEAAEQVGYQAARALARELERIRTEDDRRGEGRDG